MIRKRSAGAAEAEALCEKRPSLDAEESTRKKSTAISFQLREKSKILAQQRTRRARVNGSNSEEVEGATRKTSEKDLWRLFARRERR